jgi:RNA polymerase sigma-70 factor, ECF subfamily
MCRRLLGESWEADDAAQEASLQAFLGLEGLADPASFGPWFHAIAANLARRVVRQRRAAPVEAVPDGHGDRILWSTTTPTPEEAVAARDIHDRILSALAELSFPNREAVIRYYLGGYSYAELAQVLGVPPSSIRGRLFQGRRQLRMLLEQAPVSVHPSKGEPRATTDLVAVRIDDFVGRHLNAPDRLVLLYEQGGRRELPLILSSAEGKAVEEAMAQTPPHPTPHELLVRAVQALGGQVERMVVDRLTERTLYARIELVRQRTKRTVEARAGDAVALALLTGARSWSHDQSSTSFPGTPRIPTSGVVGPHAITRICRSVCVRAERFPSSHPASRATCHAGGRGFESRRSRRIFQKTLQSSNLCCQSKRPAWSSARNRWAARVSCVARRSPVSVWGCGRGRRHAPGGGGRGWSASVSWPATP